MTTIVDKYTEDAIEFILTKRAHKLNIKSRIVTQPCNIGTEGLLAIYDCEALNNSYPTNQCLLAIFVAAWEDFTLESIYGVPSTREQTPQLLSEILRTMQQMYIEFSIQESKQETKH